MRNGTPIAELNKPKFNSPQWFNQQYPIVSAKKYPTGLELQRENMTNRGKGHTEKRGKIRGLSPQSLNRLAFLVFTTRTTFCSIQTLTYGTPYPTDGKNIKRSLDCFLTAMSRHFGRFSFLWWLEFQEKRQAPHFHLLTTLPGPTLEQISIFGSLWAKWSFLNSPMEPGEYEKVKAVHSFFAEPGSGKSGAWEAIRRKDGAKYYILKYATKYKQKEIPPGFRNPGRMWGKSKSVKSGAFEQIDLTEDEVRQYLENKGLTVTNAPILPKRIIIPK